MDVLKIKKSFIAESKKESKPRVLVDYFDEYISVKSIMHGLNQSVLDSFESIYNHLNIDQSIQDLFQEKVVNLSEFILHKENKIDILKIDTEGYEFNILNGVHESDFKKVRYIYFEHHYDLMIDKKYKFRDINELLKKNNFSLKLNSLYSSNIQDILVIININFGRLKNKKKLYS